MKYWLVLVSGLLAVILLHNLEDYLAQPVSGNASQDYDAVDYYLTDFSLSAVAANGKVSHTLDGQYLAYWHDRNTSSIVAPHLVSKDESATQQTVDALNLTAEEAVLDHKQNTIELKGDVKLAIDNNTASQLDLSTSFLRYQFTDKHLSTDQDVRIVSPHVVLQGTGLDSKLDEAYLRLNANVKSTYQPAR